MGFAFFVLLAAFAGLPAPGMLFLVTVPFFFKQVGHGHLYGVSHFLILIQGIVLKNQADMPAVGVDKGPFPSNNDMERIPPPFGRFAEAVFEALEKFGIKLFG